MLRRALAAILIVAGLSCGARNEPAQSVTAAYTAPPDATMKVRVVFDNQLSSMFRFRRLVMRLDGVVVVGDERQDLLRDHVAKGERPQIDVRVTPGKHLLQFVIEFVGEGSGPSAYLRGYKFEIRSSRSFVAADGAQITIVAYEQDASAIEERPAVRYVETGAGGAASAMCSCPCSASEAK